MVSEAHAANPDCIPWLEAKLPADNPLNAKPDSVILGLGPRIHEFLFVAPKPHTGAILRAVRVLIVAFLSLFPLLLSSCSAADISLLFPLLFRCF
jgi:hypothetical protein